MALTTRRKASPRRSRQGARRRAALTRKRVLDAAISIAARNGIDALSMRSLGRKLDVEAMSLYNHVRDKDDILDGLVDMVFSEIEVPTDADWRTAMRKRAVSARQVLLRYPWAIGLMESRHQPGPQTLRHHDAVLGILRNAGFSVALAGHAYAVLDGYIYGFTLTELTLPFRSSKEIPKVAREIFEGFTPGDYPHLAEMAMKQAMQPGYSYGAEFEWGLDLILDGIERASVATDR